MGDGEATSTDATDLSAGDPERHRRALVHLVHAANGDPGQTAKVVAEAVAAATGVPATLVYTRRGDVAVVVAACGTPPNAVGVRVPLGSSSLAGAVLDAGTEVSTRDLTRDQRFRDPFLADLGYTTAVAVPIPDGEVPWGVVAACGHGPLREAERTRDLLEAGAALLGRSVRERRHARELLDREAHLQAILGQLPGTIWSVDRDLVYRTSVGSGLATLEVDPDEVIGRSLPDFLGVDDPTHPTVAAHLLALQGEANSYEFAQRDRIWQAYVEPAYGPDGDVVGAVGSAVDVTDTRAQAERLRTSLAQLQVMLEQLPVVLWTTDEDLVFTSSLGAGLAHLGLQPDEVRGMPVLEYIGGDEDHEVMEAQRGALAGEARSGELVFGERVWQILVEPLRGPEAVVVGTVGVAFDVTDARAAARELELSRQRLQGLFDHTLDAMVLTDDGARIVDANPAATALFGRTHDDLIGRRLRDLAAPDLRDDAPARWASFREQGSWSEDHRLLTAGGAEVEVELRAVGDIVPGLHLVLLRDVTLQREAERALRASEQRLSGVVETMVDALLIFDRDGAVEYANPAAERLFGEPRHVLEGRTYDDPAWGLRGPSGRAADLDERPFPQVVGTGEPVTGIELSAERADGTLATWSTNAAPLRDDEGTIVGVVAVLRDVSGQKRAEDTLRGALERERQAAEDLRRLDTMKNSFLQAVSHELRTPLTAVLGFASVLRDPSRLDDDQYGQVVQRLGANAERLHRLLGDLLDLDRITRGVLEPHRSPTDVVALVGHVLEVLPEGLGRVRVHGQSGHDVPIDAARTERIVENLVVNALKHTPEDTPVDVRVLPMADGVLIAVEDRGPGVPDHLKDDVFEPFRQGDSPAARVGGAGIGLTIVASFARLHRGRAWVEDREGGGASFRVLLPFQ